MPPPDAPGACSGRASGGLRERRTRSAAHELVRRHEQRVDAFVATGRMHVDGHVRCGRSIVEASERTCDAAPRYCTSVKIPVTFEAAEKAPIRSGRSRSEVSLASRSSIEMHPRSSAPLRRRWRPIRSRGARSNGAHGHPTKTTGAGPAGCATTENSRSSGSSMRKPRSPTSLFTAAVAPDPTKTTISSARVDRLRMTFRACSRRRHPRPVDGPPCACWHKDGPGRATPRRNRQPAGRRRIRVEKQTRAERRGEDGAAPDLLQPQELGQLVETSHTRRLSF